jgi:Zn-finger nucleic acid-binding protein
MTSAPSKPRCPRCRNDLKHAWASDVSMFICELCGGVWLNNDGTSRVIAALHTDAVRVAKEVAQAALAAAPTERMIACPVCAAPLERTHAGETSVIVDKCKLHGTWFDRNELIQASNLAEQHRKSPRVAPADPPESPSPAAPQAAAPASAPSGASTGELLRNILHF